MSLTGDLSTMPLPDLLQWLSSAAKTGMLQVERNKLTRWIQFEDGHVAGCSSDDPPQRLGQFLLSRELITAEQLREALAAQEGSGKHLGLTLVELGYLAPDNLSAHLEAKAEETIYSIFDWDDGIFRFDAELKPNKDIFAVRLAIPDILLRGMQRFDDMRRIREVFSDSSVVLRYTSKPPGPEIFEKRMARTMYAAIDGSRCIAEILLHVHGSEYIVNKFLFELHRNGYIEIAGHKAPEPDPEPVVAVAPVRSPLPETELLELDLEPGAADLPIRPVATVAPQTATGAAATATVAAGDMGEQLARAQELTKSGDFENALTLLDTLYRQHPDDDSLRRLTAESEKAFVHKAYQHLLPAHKIPQLNRPVESLGAESLSPEEFFMLSRIDGTWSIKSIIQVSPLREVDALRTLCRMRAMGMIDLRDPK
jgi:hypothetical protein